MSSSVIEFTIPGVPVPWGRAVPVPFKLRNGQVRVQMKTPEKTRLGEADFRKRAQIYKPRKVLAGPLRLDLVFVVPAPASFDADRSRLWPHIPSDIDNYAKMVMDSLNGMMWHDDGQVCAGEWVKVYGHPPRTIVRIRPLTAEDFERVLREIGEPVAQGSLLGGMVG